MAFDKTHSDNMTYYRNNQIRKLKSKLVLYDDDPNKEERLEKHLCKSCFYVYNDGWAGQAFTDKNCEDCGKEMIFSTTNTDSFCIECAKKNNVCKHCGGAIE